MVHEDALSNANFIFQPGVVDGFEKVSTISLDEILRNIFLGEGNLNILRKAEKKVLAELQKRTNTAISIRQIERFLPEYTLSTIRVHMSNIRKKTPHGSAIVPVLDSHYMLYDSLKPIEKNALSNPRFFTAQGKQFAITDQGQFTCFSSEKVFPEQTLAGKVWRAENASFILLEPARAALLYFFAENFTTEQTNESVMIGWTQKQRVYAPDIWSAQSQTHAFTREAAISAQAIKTTLNESQLKTLMSAVSTLRTVLPKSLQIENSRGYGYRLCER